jgi:predicted porin
MNKKILTAAVGAALAAGPMLTAQAGDVKVYGHMQFELADESVDKQIAGAGSDNHIVRTGRWDRGKNSDPATGPVSDSALTFEDNQRGRFGIAASEDLGGGLKGFAKIEYDISVAGGASGCRSGTGHQNSSFGDCPGIREANVGLQGGWGKITLGTQKTPYKYYGGVKYDPFVTTNLEARRNGGMTGGTFGHNAFASDSIGYQTAKGSPVNVWVVYSLDEKGGAGTGANGGWDDGDYSIGAKFGDKTWEAFVVTTENAHNTAGAKLDYSATKFGGKFKMGPHTFLAQLEDTENNTSATTKDEGSLLFLGYHLKFGGNNTLVVQLGDGELERTGLPIKQEWTYTTVGVVHKFSKMTRIFAGFTNTDLDQEVFVATADGSRDALSIGVRKDF